MKNVLDIGNFLIARMPKHGRLFYPNKPSEMHVPYNTGRNKAKREARAQSRAFRAAAIRREQQGMTI